MNFTVAIHLTEAYYQDYYRGWAAQKWIRRYESYLGIAMILIWGGLRFVDGANSLGIVPYFFIAVGLYETIKPFYKKRKWLQERKSSGLAGQQITLHFGNDAINTAGPFASSEIKWTGIRHIRQTSHGLFLVPENGISIFLPTSVFQSPEQVQAILSKAQPAVPG